jgi:hypothetical protein
LNAHPEVFCTEQRLFGNFFEVWPDNESESSPRITLDRYVGLLSGYYRFDGLALDRTSFEKDLLEVFISTLSNYAKSRSNKKLRVLADKITPYLGTSQLVADSINRYFSKAKIIFLVRDGRDVLTSGVFDWIYRQNLESPRYKKYVKGNEHANVDRFFLDKDIHTWTSYWNQSFDTISGISATPFTIRYEDLKSNQETTLIKLFDFLEIHNTKSCIEKCIELSAFGKMSSGRLPGEMSPTAKVRNGMVGDWKNFFTDEDVRLFKILSGARLVEWGFEPDGSWGLD